MRAFCADEEARHALVFMFDFSADRSTDLDISRQRGQRVPLPARRGIRARRDTMSTPTSTSSRKRKADALEFADDAESPPGRKLKAAATPSAHLPASCLAAVLNFMEYAEVRRCLLAGKLLAVDAARHVEVLNIMNASELVPSAARRFANITEINILSLVKEAEEAPVEDEVDDEFILSADTATRSAFFLTTFPKLKRTFLGGVYWDPGLNKWEKFPYYHTACIEPNDHLSVFRGLIDHLCGAFRSRSLSPSLHLGGVLRDNQLECHDDDHDFAIVDGRCRRCWSIATSFPLNLVLEKIPFRYECGLCLSYSKRIEALVTRHDKPFLCQSQALTKCFLAMTKAMVRFGYIDSGRAIDNDFIARMKSQGGLHSRHSKSDSVKYHYILGKDMEALKKFSTAIGPSVMKSIPRLELDLSDVSWICKTKGNGKRILVRQTFESLVQLGFDLASKDFILIDPLKEAAFEHYHYLFRSEE